MGAAPRVSPARAHSAPSGPRNNTHTAPLTELKVTGYTDKAESTKLLNFLERHSARRSPNASKGNVPPKMVKRHRVGEDALTLWVRPEDVVAFSKINGFTFNSVHGTQKLTISGPGIRSRSPNASSTMDTAGDRPQTKNSSEKNATVELLKAFLERRYNPAEKLLNLSKIAEDEEVAKSGMFDRPSTQAKFFPALMIVCDQTLKTAEEKREAIHSVTLSGNNLPNLDVVRDLATTLPHIKNLDLSGNKFSTVNDLKPWKHRFRHLEHLILEICKEGWQEEIISWFPKLRLLNGQQVRDDPSIAAAPVTAPVVAPAPTSVPVPAPTPGFTPEQEAMVTYVQEQTNLKRDMAVQCLQAANWNIENAAQLFLAQKDTLPPDSFN